MTSLTPDLSDLDTASACNQGAEIELLHPHTKAPLGIFWGILGRDSDVFKDQVRQRVNEDLRRAALNKKRGKSDDVLTVEKAEERSIGLLVSCSTHWRTVTPEGEFPHLVLKGENLAFTQANAHKVLSHQGFSWIREQIDEGIADLENFMKS